MQSQLGQHVYGQQRLPESIVRDSGPSGRYGQIWQQEFAHHSPLQIRMPWANGCMAGSTTRLTSLSEQNGTYCLVHWHGRVSGAMRRRRARPDSNLAWARSQGCGWLCVQLLPPSLSVMSSYNVPCGGASEWQSAWKAQILTGMHSWQQAEEVTCMQDILC